MSVPVPQSPRQFEEACARALQRELTEGGSAAVSWFDHTDVRLRGSYPHSEVVVSYRDSREAIEGIDSGETTFAIGLWWLRDAVGVETPEELAIQIAIRLLEA